MKTKKSMSLSKKSYPSDSQNNAESLCSCFRQSYRFEDKPVFLLPERLSPKQPKRQSHSSRNDVFHRISEKEGNSSCRIQTKQSLLLCILYIKRHKTEDAEKNSYGKTVQ